MSRALIFFVFLTCIFLGHSFASSLATPENVEVARLAQAIQMYQILNQGRLPANWDQINQIYDLDEMNKNLRYRQSYPIQDHYQFITRPMPFRAHGGVLYEKSQVLLIRTVPLANLSEPDTSQRKQWRYMVVRSKDGEVTSTRLPEQDVQAMLKSAGVTITPKPGLPAVETDAIIPEREPKPTANPNDVEYLKQHPELDPTRNVQPVESTPNPPPTVPAKAVPQPVAVPAEESGPDWFLILTSIAVVVLAGAVAFRVWKK